MKKEGQVELERWNAPAKLGATTISTLKTHLVSRNVRRAWAGHPVVLFPHKKTSSADRFPLSSCGAD